jgi:hypothetical protein
LSNLINHLSSFNKTVHNMCWWGCRVLT